jgi:hypothetical protein
MREIKIRTVQTIKSWDGLRINVPKMVIEACSLQPGDRLGIYVNPRKDGEFMVRRVEEEDKR